jgi:hypothetical protein
LVNRSESKSARDELVADISVRLRETQIDASLVSGETGTLFFNDNAVRSFTGSKTGLLPATEGFSRNSMTIAVDPRTGELFV